MISKSQGETEFSLDLESDRVEIRDPTQRTPRCVGHPSMRFRR